MNKYVNKPNRLTKPILMSDIMIIVHYVGYRWLTYFLFKRTENIDSLLHRNCLTLSIKTICRNLPLLVLKILAVILEIRDIKKFDLF